MVVVEEAFAQQLQLRPQCIGERTLQTCVASHAVTAAQQRRNSVQQLLFQPGLERAGEEFLYKKRKRRNNITNVTTTTTTATTATTTALQGSRSRGGQVFP
jgi:hypothetical protein